MQNCAIRARDLTKVYRLEPDTSVNYIAEFARGDGHAPPTAAPAVDAGARAGTAASKESACAS